MGKEMRDLGSGDTPLLLRSSPEPMNFIPEKKKEISLNRTDRQLSNR
jgi:hypothetical protein